MTYRFICLGLAGLALAGCGGGSPPPPTPDAAAAGYVRLIEAEWTLAPGEQAYYCEYKTVTEDMLVGEFAPVIPLGTHHTVLTVGVPAHADGLEPCDVASNARNMLFGSGVGTNNFVMPPGVAVRIHAGQQLVLNMHLFNAGDAPLTGVSGTDVRVLAREAVQIEAEAVLAGPIDLSIPPGLSTATGTCTIRNPVSIFGVGSHMHLLGRHMAVTARPAGRAPALLLDRDYSFDAQVIQPIAPFALDANDTVEVACTYDNPTADTVHFGETTQDEMCFTGLYWYPAHDTPLLCAS